MSPKRLIPACFLAALFALCASSAQAAPTITEYSAGLTKDAGPWGIAAGPDNALWFTEVGKGRIGRISIQGTITEFTSGLGGSDQPRGITLGPDGNLWFAAAGGSGAIGRITPAGSVTKFTSGLSNNGQPREITTGPDGNLWFTEPANPGRIGRINPGTGIITEFPIPSANSAPHGIVAGPDGSLWFTESADPGRIGRISPATGAVTEYPLPTANRVPEDIAAGPDGNLYFTESGDPGAIGKLDPHTGAVTELTVGLTANREPQGIAAGVDGALWFTEFKDPGALGRMLPGGAITELTAGLTTKLKPASISTGPDGNLWFTENGNPGQIGRVTVAPGAVTTAATAVNAGSARLHATVRANAQSTTYYFQYGPTTSYGAQTAPTSVGAPTAAQDVSTYIGGLSTATTYHYRVIASNASGTTVGADQAVTTTLPDGSPAPVADGTGVTGSGVPEGSSGPDGTFSSRPEMGRTVVAAANGVVLVKVPGATRFVRLGSAASVPIGARFDARRGTLKLVTALDHDGTRTQTATFSAGMFDLRQARTGEGLVDIYLRGHIGACPRTARGRTASAARKRPTRQLWGKDSNGRYRTHGKNSVATVRGTRWLTIERCDGTLTRVTAGKVLVRDLRRHRSVLVASGHQYLARTAR